MKFIDYIEAKFGTIEGGRVLKEIGFPHLQVVQIIERPFEGLTTFITLGMSRKKLQLPKERFCKQELVFTTYSKEIYFESISSVLLTFSQLVLQSQNAILRGEVIGPGEPFIEGGTCNSFYATSPIFFGDDLEYKDIDTTIIFVWLIPLMEIEAIEVRKIGWNEFENVLEILGENYDFWDLNRTVPFYLTPHLGA